MRCRACSTLGLAAVLAAASLAVSPAAQAAGGRRARPARVETRRVDSPARRAENPDGRTRRARVSRKLTGATAARTKARATTERAARTESKARTKSKARTEGKARTRSASRRSTSRGRATGRRLTRDQREQAAVARVRKILKEWTPPGAAVDVRLAPQQIVVTSNNPVVGRGPIDVVISPRVPAGAGFWKRLSLAMSSRLNRRMLIGVNERGEATVLAETSNSLPSRAVRSVLRALPIQEILFDAVNSRESRSGMVMALVSMSQWHVNPAIAAGGVVMAAQMVRSGTGRRREARKSAMTDTAAWIARRGDGKEGFPSLSEAYRYYKQTLEDSKPGTRPVSMRRFVEDLLLYDVLD